MSVDGTRRLLTGDGLYVDDIRLPEMLHLAFVRSPHAHAQVLAVNTGEALAARGVAAVLTARDLGSLNAPLPQRFHHRGLRHPQTPRPLADGVVRFVGEPVAVVAAESRYLAADAADLVRVDYLPLPCVASLEAARATGAPLVHEAVAGNLAGRDVWRLGNPDVPLRHAPVRLAFRLAISRGAANPIETRGCVAHHDPATGELTLWASTQGPHNLRRMIARVLRLPDEKVRVVAPDVGGAFGVKGGTPPEYVVAAYLALVTGRPVKWIEDRREHFLACQQDREQIHHIEIAATGEGDLLALRDQFWLDVGAYALYGHLIGMHTAAHMVGPYRLQHMEVRLESVYTHRVPGGAYRGAGRPQGTFVIERAMDHVAHSIGMDPVDVRQRNLIPPHTTPWDTGFRLSDDRPVIYDSGDYPRLLQEALQRFDYTGWRSEQRRRRAIGEGPYLGLGVACYVQETAAHGGETVTIRMDGAGQVSVSAGPSSQGQELIPLLTRIVAQELSTPAERIRVTTGDTAAMPDSDGTYGSRVATLLGNAATLAARYLAARLGAPGREAGARGAGNPLAASSLTATATFHPEGSAWSSGVHLAALEVDAETGGVQILRYLVVHDCGRPLDEGAVVRQILGGVVQGIGGSLYEDLKYEASGQPLVTTLADYGMPRAAQVPPIEVACVGTPSPLNPLGLKGAGEGGVMAVYAVVASAIEDALAHTEARITSLPVSALRIWEMLHQPPATPEDPEGRRAL